ncbi:hypothetical protein BGX33_008654 [Mortierella sp. NVP41]|nr:hypothetical protein BGX33_008654 [Mortierella sp. NVP41]
MYAKRPKVLIVGAGLGGLTLGMLLQKAGIPYEIFERAAEVKPLGSAMYFNATTAPLFKQCGLYDEFLTFGKFVSALQMCNEEREVEYMIDFDGQRETFGADGYIVARPKLYDMLLRQIPKDHIHFGKKMLSMEQGGNGILVRFSNGTEAQGDILVGADGAYSAVRQSLYAKLQKAKSLPASDALPLPFTTVCIVGQTRPLDPSQFPDIALPECQFRRILGDNKPYSACVQWATFTTKENTVCWFVVQYLDDKSSKENDAFRNSEWGPEAAGAMCNQVRSFPIISGDDKKITMGDLIDWTPQELISKVMLEQKVFKTWFDCRTVLLGDACHKMNPSGGAGAASAMHDAIVLANLINALPLHPVTTEIEEAFKAYQAERLPWVKEAFDSSNALKTMAGTNTMAKVVRFCAKHMPAWVMRRAQVRMAINRPQVAFLPRADDTGTVRPAPQPSLSAKAPEADDKPTIAV